MKQTVNEYDFTEAFRAQRPDNFSYDALRLLFEYFEEYEASIGEEIELDVIAICCEFYEDTWQEIADNYSIDLTDCETDEEREQAVEEYLTDNTSYVGNTSHSLVYAAF